MLMDEGFCSLNYTTSSNCSSCFYGPLCQFSTAYYGITSLQTLLCSFEYIPISIIISISLFGSICNLFTIGTFCQSKTREMGSGIYRLWISIIGQCGLTIVVIHILMENNNNGIIGCFILEYFRKAFHALYDSLTACTTLERTMVIYQGISFNKIHSRRLAKLIIPILILYHFISILYEPFYRQVIYSLNRYWCILKFPSHLIVTYQRITNLYFILPYFINLILPMIWILALTKSKLTLNKNLSIWMNLKNVIFTYKHTIISCYILVLLNTPRFIFTFYLTCIKLQWQNTAYITAYFLSLVPLMFNLFIFVLPSPKYRPEFFSLIQRVIKYRRRNHYIPT
ncbi:unnamed protein product [Rotaria sordida]|uniref:Uncharacterized protein n=1 Tax=Rotaria sordida TaxID=392033 RepID=A0A815BJR0_9BILA|nr:unnamed protein product [Rotaria sordida]CAF1270530.1 unnamed protein product [Rotaria sordida]CAF3493979.1 unnamed protein product [Rotaria sordida]CAF3572649.1 unnamed protein product [Rotaria sordida]